MARQILLVALIVFIHGILLVAGQSECQTPPCENGGTCNQEADGYTCTCVVGYTGTDCETEACASDNDCENGGTCKADKTCTCATGYTGDLCDTDIDDCDGHLCKNPGTCVDGVAGYTCTCDLEWTGTTCESVACAPDNECDNGGTCEDDKTCTCATGYTGDLCDTDINDCAGDPCQITEVCKDEVAGYTCTVACDDTDNVCANGGTCGTDSTCTCAPGNAGDLCDSVACDDTGNVCANGGTCGADSTCICAPGYAGDLCTESGVSLSTASCLILALALALTKMATD